LPQRSSPTMMSGCLRARSRVPATSLRGRARSIERISLVVILVLSLENDCVNVSA
jgi:hypothetical protein